MIDLKSTLRPVHILRIGIILAIMGAIFIILNFLPKNAILPNSSYWDSNDPMEPGSIKKVGIGFILKGHVFVGKITVFNETGWKGEKSQIYVRLQDSSGNTTFASGLVDETHSFTFEAPKDDSYYFIFDNSYSSLDPSTYERKWVFWQIYYYGNSTVVFQVSASIFWTSGIICIGLYLFKREEPVRRDVPSLAEEVIKKIVKGTKR